MAPQRSRIATMTRGPSKAALKTPCKRFAPNLARTRKAKAQKKCKQIFAGMTMSCSGNFGSNWEHEKIAMWVKNHGGDWQSDVTEDTTHLICTVEDYKKKTQQVRKAWALGRKCGIVVRDWLEDSLIVQSEKKKRARAEKGYTLDRVLKRVSQSDEQQEKYRASFEEGIRAGHELVDNRLNHVYYDSSGFEYKIVCTRVNDFGRAKVEKYTINLFETNAKPSTYIVGAKLTSNGRSSYWRSESRLNPFPVAFAEFKKFFFTKTGIAWDDRCDGLPYDESKFRYNAPALGRPVGDLPPGKKSPGFGDDDEPAAEGERDTATTDSNDEGLIYDTNSEVEDTYSTSNVNRSKRSSKSSSSRSVISISSSGSF